MLAAKLMYELSIFPSCYEKWQENHTYIVGIVVFLNGDGSSWFDDLVSDGRLRQLFRLQLLLLKLELLLNVFPEHCSGGRGGNDQSFERRLGRRRQRLRQLGVDDAVLAPLVLLHRLLPEKLLPANVALEGTVVATGSLVHLKIIYFLNILRKLHSGLDIIAIRTVLFQYNKNVTKK